MPGKVNSKTRKLQLMAEIRKLCAQGYNVTEQLQLLGGLNRRTYFRYLNHVYEKDRKALENQHSIEEIMKQFVVMIDRYNRIYRELESISSDPKNSASDRHLCLLAMKQLARAIVSEYAEGRQQPLIQELNLEQLKQKKKERQQQQQQQPYQFPMTEIFNPNDRSPYTAERMILRPEEQQ